MKKYTTYGGSPARAIAIAEAARAYAALAGRPTVGFEDVKAVAPHVLNHRLILNYQAQALRPCHRVHLVIEGLLGEDRRDRAEPSGGYRGCEGLGFS